MVQCIINPNAKNLAFNITRGNSRTLIEAAEVAKQVTNSKSDIVLKEHNKLYSKRGTCSIAKAEAKLGYKPKYDIEEGFAQTYNWLKSKI